MERERETRAPVLRTVRGKERRRLGSRLDLLPFAIIRIYRSILVYLGMDFFMPVFTLAIEQELKPKYLYPVKSGQNA